MAEATANADLARNIDRLRGRPVLVLDSDPVRLRARGDAMESRGANVTCSGSASRARSVWKPGSHFLVLIELGDAGPQFQEFHHYAAKLDSTQAFGFYTSQPPYLTSAMPASGALNHVSDATHTVHPAPAVPPAYAGLIAKASQLIAAIRPLARPVREHRTGSTSFSQAVRAAERLIQQTP